MKMKVHKPTLCGRPIGSCPSSALHYASKFLHITLLPLVTKIPSLVKNGYQIVSDLENKKFPANSILLSADINSLYPNIDIDDGLH